MTTTALDRWCDLGEKGQGPKSVIICGIQCKFEPPSMTPFCFVLLCVAPIFALDKMPIYICVLPVAYLLRFGVLRFYDLVNINIFSYTVY